MSRKCLLLVVTFFSEGDKSLRVGAEIEDPIGLSCTLHTCISDMPRTGMVYQAHGTDYTV